MPLEKYREKRHFERTPEPKGAKREAKPQAEPRFVIQKHDASRLHYDLRLEMEGVYRSWAVPKGPSFDPTEKRLAVEVEDHPLEYGTFEGIIPEGEYGGGTVMVWDRGTYRSFGDAAEEYRSGSMKFELHGDKLGGAFALVRMKRREGEKNENWLLIKERDEFARPHADYDVLKAMPDSAKTGRTMEEIAASGETQEDQAEAGEEADVSRVAGARKARAPASIAPELTTKVDHVAEDERWIHEIKLDGYRVLCHVEGEKVRFFTRKGLDWTDTFVSLIEPVRALGLRSAWLDGEVCVTLPDGRTSFGALQAELKRGKSANLTYFVFDVLYLDGYDLREAALVDRKRLLESAMQGAGDRVRYVEHVIGHGEDFYRQTCAFALEGSIAKRAQSRYREGRVGEWLKRKCLGREDFAVIGYTLPTNGGPGVGALVLASRAPSGELAFAGRVGTGWNDAESRDLRQRLEALEVETPPLELPAKDRKGVRWTKPDLDIEVAFVEWTEAGLVRHASFEGVREDMSTPTGGARDADTPAKGGGERLAITHPDKQLYGDAGVTKLDLAEYYVRVAEWMLPHLADRPLVLVRCPEGAEGECFFQKETSTGFPESIKHVSVQHEEGPVVYGLVDSAEGLVALVQMNVLEIHTWGSRGKDIEHPDRLIFDLDPGPDVSWEAVRDGALLVKEIIEDLGAQAFLKTTGGKGLHVVMPMKPHFHWQQARDLAKGIAERVARTDPSAYTTNMRKNLRQGRIFVDYVRNTRGASAIAAYSCRARPGATVSVPIRWDELKAGLRSDSYDVKNVPRRLASLGSDPWKDYDRAAVDPRKVDAALAASVRR